MRSATTALHHYLSAHPDISMSREKETDFFIADRNFDRGIKWYESLYDRSRHVRGEASPNYTKRHIFPGVAERIHVHSPDCKLIYVVRDPVKRAISQYTFAMAQIPPGSSLTEDNINDIIKTSCYHYQLEEYLKYFPRENILVLDYEEIKTEPLQVLSRISGHISLEDKWGDVKLDTKNSTGELSRLPLWFFELRKNRLLMDLRRMMPTKFVGAVRGALATGPKREIPPVPPALIERTKQEAGPDAERFRQLVGQSFDGWSI